MPTTEKKSLLANLPNELVTQILSNIHGQRHLAKIALVFKQFKTIVESLLYRHISLDVQYATRELTSTSFINEFQYAKIDSFLPFDRLVENLSMRQDLARHVRRLDLRVRRRLGYMPFAAHSRLLQHLLELRALSLSPPPYELSIPASDPYELSIPASDWTIKSLQLDFSHVTDHYDDGRDWLYNGVPLYVIAKYLQLAKLRKLQAVTVYFASGFDDTRHLPIRSSSIVDLRFLNCLVSKSDSVLASLIRSIKYLERFVIEFWSSPYVRSSTDPFGAFEVALSDHQETIKELAIATSAGLAKICWSLGPFTHWSGLTRLAVPSDIILGNPPRTRKLHEILPPLLEEFQIEHSTAQLKRTMPQISFQQSPVYEPTRWPGVYDSAIDAARAEDVADMRLLAAKKEICVPKLKLVIWWYQTPKTPSEDYFDYPIDRTLAGLRLTSLAFEKVGVEFKWVTESLFKDTPFGKRLCEWQE